MVTNRATASRPPSATAPSAIAALAQVAMTGCPVLETSAKTGQGVEEAFLELARLVL